MKPLRKQGGTGLVNIYWLKACKVIFIQCTETRGGITMMFPTYKYVSQIPIGLSIFSTAYAREMNHEVSDG